MTLLLQSIDVDSGHSYDGVWNLNHKVAGRWNAHYMYWATGNIPWIWSGVNAIRVGINLNETGYDYYIKTVTVGSTETNTTTIGNAIAAAIESIFVDIDLTDETTVTCTYDASNTRYILDIAYNSPGHSVSLRMKITWTDPACTIAGVFDKNVDETSNAYTLGDIIFYLPAQHVGNVAPKFLQVKIDECNSYLVTSCNAAFGNLLMSTGSIPLTNQYISFLENERSLHIGLYRNNISILACPATNLWNMVLVQE